MTGKPALYRTLAERLAALLAGETDPIAGAANTAALIYHGLPDLTWAGFYFRQGEELVLGPFQGKPAVTRIAIGAGVCGPAAARCELVVPLVEDGTVTGVLDLDSPLPARFDAADQEGCERLVALFLAHFRQAPARTAYPADVDPQSGCRLPLPRREELDEIGRRLYDRLADPAGGTLRGLRGPGGIHLHSPGLSRHAGPLNHYLRHEAGLGERVRALAVLVTARECDSPFIWLAHEPAAAAAGLSREIRDVVRYRRPAEGLAEADAIVIALGREIFGNRRVAPATYARALRQFGRRRLVDLVALMGNYAATAALLAAFDMQPDPGQTLPWPH